MASKSAVNIGVLEAADRAIEWVGEQDARGATEAHRCEGERATCESPIDRETELNDAVGRHADVRSAMMRRGEERPPEGAVEEPTRRTGDEEDVDASPMGGDFERFADPRKT